MVSPAQEASYIACMSIELPQVIRMFGSGHGQFMLRSIEVPPELHRTYTASVLCDSLPLITMLCSLPTLYLYCRGGRYVNLVSLFLLRSLKVDSCFFLGIALPYLNSLCPLSWSPNAWLPAWTLSPPALPG